MMTEHSQATDKATSKPWHMMFKVLLVIIIAEASIMELFNILPMPELDKYELAALDALLLGLSVAPALYFFLLLPLQRQTISEQKNRFVMYDSLTGLPRRELFLELVKHEISRARRDPYCAALIVIDPSHLSGVNQTFGYKVGDALLSQLAGRIQSALRESDIVSRLGGDEFGVLLTHTDIKLVNKIRITISNALEKPFVVNGIHLDIGYVMGAAIFPDHADSADDLIRRADMAGKRAKKEKEVYAVYDIQDESSSHQRLVIFGQLRRAIKGNKLELYYQPKISQRNAEVAGVEALVRWIGEHGQPPSVFIPLAEQTGLINDITRWVFKEAIDQCSAWKEKGLLIPVSINVSPRNLYSPKLFNYFIQYVEEKSLPYSLITIEVTESAIMRRPKLAIELLSQLKERGFKISIDDFGTGYSSLAYLKKIPATELKIDQSFIANILSDKKDEILVKATIALAKDLELQTVIEGVETEDVLKKLKSFDCDIVQGYYYSRPLSSAAYLEWHQQWNTSNGHTSSPLHPVKQ
jgi:diguanylate cyclase (GGDEF)-like protein